jgi:DNA modification methylase/superfamily II DNA or RNA helicase
MGKVGIMRGLKGGYVEEYESFLASKTPNPTIHGLEPGELNEILYPFQVAITEWAIRRGRAAIFADCGLGKTFMQLEWARQSGKRVLIVAPLNVAEQTIGEAEKLNIKVTRVHNPIDSDCIQITNYQKLHHFIGHPYDAIVLDESSILKSLDGKTRTMLIKEFSGIPRRLCCTATPAPNDLAELANHSEFLGIMPRNEMLASFFIHDANGAGAGKWRIKGHAQELFWKWVAKWAIYIRKPSDLGFDDGEFELPPLNIMEEVVDTDWKPEGTLFAAALGGIQERRQARKSSIEDRIDAAQKLIMNSGEQFLVWCGLNEESTLLAKRLGSDAVNVEGSTEDDDRIKYEQQWRSGQVQTLISKPSIFGFGMNWQHCRKMIFLGIGDSYEQYYQSIRRCWRFGQNNPVDVSIIVSEREREIVKNVRTKEETASEMAAGVIACSKDAMIAEVFGSDSARTNYQEEESTGEDWIIKLGDCVERVKEIESGSVGVSVFSPPFASLYTYSASDRDMGNSKSYDEFFRHFKFLIPEIQRITMPGRRCLVHVQQVTTTQTTHGVIGWRDFRADTVRAFVECGWVYDGEVVIDKDPQAQAIRTKSKALMFVQKNKDSSWCRPAMADYILCFRHPGDNEKRIVPDVSNEEWILWARPIWYGIRESDTLNAKAARTEKDERHIAPLQLGTIERCIRLWSCPGEIVFSPFAGIGSEGYVAIQHGRKYIGIELKPEYYKQAVKNVSGAKKQGDLFT